MGDPRRFDAFADYIVRHWPDRTLSIADVAGGKGGLQAALRQRGYDSVVSFDRRHKYANPGRTQYRYGLFGPNIRDNFALVVGMHPDGGTDAALAYALARRVPCAVVPCCAVPTVWPFPIRRGSQRLRGSEYHAWMRHLAGRAENAGAGIVVDALRIGGRNLVLRAIPA